MRYNYEQLRSALWEVAALSDSQDTVSEKKHVLHTKTVGLHSGTTAYHPLIAEFHRLQNEMQVWRGAFEEESKFLKQQEPATRLRFAQSRPFLKVL